MVSFRDPKAPVSSSQGMSFEPRGGEIAPSQNRLGAEQLNSSNVFVIPLSNDEFLPVLSRWTTLGGLVLLTALGSAVGLTAVTPLPTKVRTAGVVRPVGEVKVVQATMEGTVREIQVEEAQSVKVGDAIARIDDSRLQTRRRQLENSIQQNQLQIQQIDLQIGNLEQQANAEKNLVARTTISAQAEFAQAEREHRDRQIQALQQVQEAEATMTAAKVEFEALATAAQEGVIPMVQVEGKYQAYQAAVARWQGAKTGLNPSEAPVAIAREQIAQAQAQGDSTQASLQSNRAALVQQQVQLRAKIQQDQQEITQLDKELEETVIRAQASGHILSLNLRNDGQVVRTGDVIAQIMPQEAPLLIKARVLPQDIGQIEVEQPVRMRVSAYVYTDYGTLDGKVVAIGSDAVASQSSGSASGDAPAGIPYYEITIQPNESYLTRSGKKYFLQPGMDIQADIITKDENALKFILRKARIISTL